MSGLVLAGLPQAVAAQNEIVQPLPPPEAEDLNEALRRLSQSPSDLDALLEAGEASIVLGDSDAAMGFFVRAQDLSPANARMKAGLGRVFLAEGRAIEALRFFAEAETAGYPLVEMAADRGLAFDLVGDNLRAQELYRLALARNDDPATSRRLALSLAIAGERAEFERILLRQLQDEDRAGFRTRAFGLAILGDEREAISIAEALMPTDLALRMTPYLRYMARLTKAQQAAAANLGTFPRASDIGRDMPAIAGYSDQGSAISRQADASLTPSGPVMGSNRPSQAAAIPAAAPRQPTRAERRQAERGERQALAGLDPMSRARARSSQAQTTPAPAPAPTPAITPTPAPAQAPRPAPAAAPAPAPAQRAIAVPTEAPPPSATVAPVQGPAIGREERIEAFDLPASTAGAGEPAPVLAPDRGPLPAGSLEDVFAEFEAIPAAPPRAVLGAVDVTAIQPPRERAAPPPAPERKPPPPPVHPARHWVQVATGRDRDALKFDWRRISRNAKSLLDGKGPFVTPWVEANRLLAGPYPSAGDAREIVTQLKAMGIDAFTFASPRGQEIETLD
ncbi:MAG: SPOR domain-containing protein [Alphaproteobacteria bacterium]|nr:SPOR domain-containing protein [Alphaproteobacteria bacterium]